MVVPQVLGLVVFITSEPMLSQVTECTGAQCDPITAKRNERDRKKKQSPNDGPAIPVNPTAQLDITFRKRRLRMREGTGRPLTRWDARRPELRRRMNMV